jgi:hypothetical protein
MFFSDNIKERENMNKQSTETILQVIKNKAPQATADKILKARKFSSGDIQLVTQTQKVSSRF